MSSITHTRQRLLLAFAALVISNQGIDIAYASEACGDELSCQNGGSCIETLDFSKDGTTATFHCDCPTEWTGSNCELENTGNAEEQATELETVADETADSTPEDEGDESDNQTEEAEEKDDNENNNEVDAGNDDTGDDNDGDVVCHLQCNNGGTCAKGVKDLGLLQDIVTNVTHLNETHDEELFEHCVCPEGWTGLQCDYQVEICGMTTAEDGTSVPEHVCFHGSSCVKYGNQYGCDCSAANNTFGEDDDNYSAGYTLFAGDTCEYPATDICVRPGSFATVNQEPGESNYFCVNDGRCYGYVSDLKTEKFPGCACPPGWTGDHCEVPTEIYNVEKKSSAEKAVLLGTAIFVVLGVIVAGAILLRSEDDSDRVYGVTKPKKNNDKKKFWQGRSAQKGDEKKEQEDQQQQQSSSTSARAIPPPVTMFAASSQSSSGRKVIDLHSLSGVSSSVLDKIVEENRTNAFIDPEAQKQQQSTDDDDDGETKEDDPFRNTLFLKSDEPPEDTY